MCVKCDQRASLFDCISLDPSLMMIAVVYSIHYLFGLIKFGDTLSLLRIVRSIYLKYLWFIAIKEAVYVIFTAYTSWQH